jgi:hypothetical protein
LLFRRALVEQGLSCELQAERRRGRPRADPRPDTQVRTQPPAARQPARLSPPPAKGLTKVEAAVEVTRVCGPFPPYIAHVVHRFDTHSRMRGRTVLNVVVAVYQTKSARFCSRPAPRCMSGEALLGMPWRQPCCRRRGQPAHGRSGDEQPADEPDQSTKQVASHRVNVDFSSS